MRKDKKHQQNKDYVQMQLFDRSGKPVLYSDGGTIVDMGTGDELFSGLKEQRTSTDKLLEQVLAYANLRRAFRTGKIQQRQ